MKRASTTIGRPAVGIGAKAGLNGSMTPGAKPVASRGVGAKNPAAKAKPIATPAPAQSPRPVSAPKTGGMAGLTGMGKGGKLKSIK